MTNIILILLLAFCGFIMFEIYRTDRLNKIAFKEVSTSLYEMGIIIRAMTDNLSKEQQDNLNESYKKIKQDIEREFDDNSN